MQATLQGVAMDCQKSVTIMPGQESRIICQSTKPYGLDAGTFSTLLNIELSYGYVSAAVLPMTVTRVSGQVC